MRTNLAKSFDRPGAAGSPGRRIQGDLHDLRMPGDSVADRFIRRIRYLTAGIAGYDGKHAVETLKHGFQTPKASSPKGDPLGGF